MKKIIVKNNEEYKVRVISKPNEEEFIYPYFVQATKELQEIIEDTKKYHANDNSMLQKSNDFSNNIIAFSGNRGQGKSSAMLSFSNFLMKKSVKENKELLGNEVCECNYLVLDRIDPTKFEIGDNILTVILAKIFHEFCNLWNDSDKTNVDLRTELLESFQNCYREIGVVKNTTNNSNSLMCSDLEQLGRIGNSANLKDHLMQLLDNFFEFKCRIEGENSKKDYFLVIQLDDTDLNTEKAYQIVEDVRKYFMIPNVVVLMAVDLTLLTYSIEQMYIKQFETYENFSKKTRIPEYHQMAVKYIDKLIPGNRKIFLPLVKTSSDEYGNQVTIEYLNTKNENLLNFKDNSNQYISDVQDLLLRFIYEKTGIIFVKPNRFQHGIVPDTMRELVNFLTILNRMESINNDFNDAKDLETRLTNLASFESFFKNIWIVNHISDAYMKAIHNFINASWNNKNKQIIKDIEVINKTILKEKDNTKFDSLLSEKKHRFSLSDVREVLNILEDIIPTEDIFSFTFAIKTLYTIFLNKLIYNQLLQEEVGEYVDYDLVLNFVGGDVFGKSVSEFVRTENNKFERALFDIKFKDKESENQIRKYMDNFENAFIAGAFCNFSFPSSDVNNNEPYEERYIRSNNSRSSNWTFNVSNPLIYLIQPKKILHRLSKESLENEDVKIEYPKGIIAPRYSCVQIVSNLDLISCLEKFLKTTATIKSNNWDFTQYIIDFYLRIQTIISSVSYIPANKNWEDFMLYISKNRDFLNWLHGVSVENKNEELDLSFIREGVDYYKTISNLQTFRGTKTITELLSKCNKIYDKLFDINLKYNSIEVDLAIDDLTDLISQISNYTYLSQEEVYDYQKSLNAIIRELKESV